MTTKLPLHEWCIILLFCLILLVLSAFALRGEKTISASRTAQPPANELEIKIDGEVAKPGAYTLPIKSSLKELLAQAQPLPTADLSQLNGRRKLRDGQEIHVPKREWISIQIVGMVPDPGTKQILSGTRIYELASQLQVLPEADMKAMSRRKRYLYEGDVVEVPAKKVAYKDTKKRRNQE